MSLVYEVIPSVRFTRNVKKLIRKHSSLKPKVKSILKELQSNPEQTSLKFHKVGGRNNWAVSVTYDIRIIIHWQGKYLYLTNIGSHDEVY